MTRPKSKTKKLTVKQKKFVDGICSGKFQGQAYIDAGYKIKTLAIANTEACLMMRKPHIKYQIDKRMGKVAKKADIKAEEVIQELKAMGLSSITDVITWDADGRISVIPSDQLPNSVKSAIKKIKSKKRVHKTRRGDEGFTEYELEIEMHAKSAPLEKLGEYLGLWKPKEGDVLLLQQFMLNVQNKYGVTEAE